MSKPEPSKYDFNIRVLQNGHGFYKFQLLEDITFQLSEPIGGTITVPAGFIFDGRSSPGFMKHLMPTFGKRALAYLLHDYLYANDIGIKELGERRGRKWQDSEMLRMGRVVYPAKWWHFIEIESVCSYWLVRIFGRKEFRNILKQK